MSKPLNNFTHRDTPNLAGWSLAPDTYHHADNRDPISEQIREEIAASKYDTFVPGMTRLPPIKYPPVVRDDPGSWPVIWGGEWRGE